MLKGKFYGSKGSTSRKLILLGFQTTHKDLGHVGTCGGLRA